MVLRKSIKTIIQIDNINLKEKYTSEKRKLNYKTAFCLAIPLKNASDYLLAPAPALTFAANSKLDVRAGRKSDTFKNL